MPFSDEQRSNAAVIAQVGRSLGASSRDILIAIMTAMQESGLRNLNYGDRDSIGLFQQRNAWASREARLDPRQSARMFFLGGNQGQRGLLDFSQRDQWSLTQAAQKVQVSAFPNAYAKHESGARELLRNLGADPGVPEVPNQPLDSLNLADPALVQDNGIDTSAPPVTPGAPLGVEAADAPGIESGDEMPEMDFGLDVFEQMNATGPDGGSTFEELFPQKGIVDGARGRVGQLARQVLGTPYSWGGTSPDKGFDCSGFVQWVMTQVGVDLPRMSFQQARAGTRVGLDQLQLGDLVAWDNSARNNGADHIAIYLGDGLVIESPRPGVGVRIRSVRNDGDAWGVKLNY